MSMGTEIGYLHDASLKKTEISSRIMGAVHCYSLLSGHYRQVQDIKTKLFFEILWGEEEFQETPGASQLWAFVGSAGLS